MESIWTYSENQSIDTDKVDLKPFKPTGKFFDDVNTLIKLFGIKTHPALRLSTYRNDHGGSSHQSHNEEDGKEVAALTFYKYRLDKNTLRATFLCLPSAQIIQTLKFSNNGLTHSQMLLLLHYLSEDNCPVTNLFLDWNPIYSDDFVAGDRVPTGTNQLYQP